jgi:phosphatidyl-N-methylethanolamine N-methyltransferase
LTFAALIAGALLAVERACYVWIARRPRSFRAWAARPSVAWLGEPVAVVEKLFYAFKVQQLAVFIGWCYLHDPSLMPSAPPAVIAVSVVLFVAGQSLVMIGFYRLGRVAVFFGDRLGYDAPWCSAFPFSVLPHPQYLGAVVSSWAFFAVMRYPHADWYVIPLIETIYYVAGATLEERGVAAQGASGRAPSNPTLSKD